MKKFSVMLSVLFLFIGGCNLLANKNGENISAELSKVEISDSNIDSLINTVILDNQDYLAQGCFLLMGLVKESDGNYYVNIVVYEKEKFIITCQEDNYPILGYFEVSKQTVLIVGELYFDRMKFLDERKVFTFKCLQIGKEYPPSLYNPPSYRFLYKKT